MPLFDVPCTRSRFEPRPRSNTTGCPKWSTAVARRRRHYGAARRAASPGCGPKRFACYDVPGASGGRRVRGKDCVHLSRLVNVVVTNELFSARASGHRAQRLTPEAQPGKEPIVKTNPPTRKLREHPHL